MTTAAQKLTLVDALECKIAERTARVAVIGMGYVGLPLALMFADSGFQVVGFDIDPAKVDALCEGKSYIHQISEAEIRAAREKQFVATADFSRFAEIDVAVLCVPTPLNEYREPDVSYIENTARMIAPHIRAGQCIILESTTYPGTTEEVLVPILEHGNAFGLKACRDDQSPQDCFYVAYSPEREDPGNTAINRTQIPKVVGGVSRSASNIAGAFYNTVFERVVHVSSTATAEMTKLLENTYRCVNIALVNELKLFCERAGIDIWEVIDAASTKPFGFQAFYPGPGLGGHCIPVDPFYLSWRARMFDFQAKFIELAGEINTQMPYHVMTSVMQSLCDRKLSLNGARVLVLGVAYKKDVDDLRESPALTIIELLRKSGADVSYHDPYIPHIGRGRHYDLNMDSVPLSDLSAYDCVLILTDHSNINFEALAKEASLVVDTRNATRNLKRDNVVRC